MSILIDKNNVLPKWFGYLNLCNALTEIVVSPAWIFDRGGVLAHGSTLIVTSNPTRTSPVARRR